MTDAANADPARHSNRSGSNVSGMVRLMPEVAALFTRIPKRGAGDRFADRHDWDGLEDAAPLLADAKPDALEHPVTLGAGVESGLHQVLFHLSDFIAERERPPPPLHYLLPIKFTPWGFSLYRGA